MKTNSGVSTKQISTEIKSNFETLFDNLGIKLQFSTKLSELDAQYISKYTKEEKYLEFISPVELQEKAGNGYYSLIKDQQIIACIFLYKYKQSYSNFDLFERGTLRVDSKYRGHNLGSHLMKQLTLKHDDKNIISISSNAIVQNNNIEMNFLQLNKEDLSQELIHVLLEGGELIDSYKYFLNTKLLNLLQENND